jgi:hypothetical protein
VLVKRRRREKTGVVPKQLREYPFKPGQSGNPGGRPIKKYRQLAPLMANDLTEAAPNHIALALALPPGATWGQCISRRALKMAALGDIQAMRLIHDCVDLQTSLRVTVNAEASERELAELRSMFKAKVEEEAQRMASPQTLDIVPVEVKTEEAISVALERRENASEK